MGKNLSVKEITFGVCGSLIDFFIWYIAWTGASLGRNNPRGLYRAFQEADDFLEKVNHHTLISVWHQLTKKRLITYQKRNNLYSPVITEFGRKRLEKNLPQYHKDRPWDKRIYLITYDIPEKARIKRDKFRSFLKEIGAKLLQESTFLSPYNPRQLIGKFSQKNQIPGNIIISDVGSDGGVGETNIQDLLVRLYSLEKINERYEEFIKNVKNKNKSLKLLLFEYLSVLKDDPQLPFPLLPNGWLGNKAYFVSKRLKYI